MLPTRGNFLRFFVCKIMFSTLPLSFCLLFSFLFWLLLSRAALLGKSYSRSDGEIMNHLILFLFIPLNVASFSFSSVLFHLFICCSQFILDSCFHFSVFFFLSIHDNIFVGIHRKVYAVLANLRKKKSF